MRNGDISNKEAPVIAFNVDNLLFEKEEFGGDMLAFVTKHIFPKSRKVNQSFVDIVNNIWYNYEFSLYLISKNSVEDTERYLEGIDIQATKIVRYTGIDNLRRLLNYRYYLYVDSDKDLISVLSCKNAIHIDELPKYLSITRR